MAVTIKEVNHRETKKIHELTIGNVFKHYNTLFVVTDYQEDEFFEAMIITPKSEFGEFGQLRQFFYSCDGDKIVEMVKNIEIKVEY